MTTLCALHVHGELIAIGGCCAVCHLDLVNGQMDPKQFIHNIFAFGPLAPVLRHCWHSCNRVFKTLWLRYCGQSCARVLLHSHQHHPQILLRADGLLTDCVRGLRHGP